MNETSTIQRQVLLDSQFRLDKTRTTSSNFSVNATHIVPDRHVITEAKLAEVDIPEPLDEIDDSKHKIYMNNGIQIKTMKRYIKLVGYDTDSEIAAEADMIMPLEYNPVTAVRSADADGYDMQLWFPYEVGSNIQSAISAWLEQSLDVKLISIYGEDDIVISDEADCVNVDGSTTRIEIKKPSGFVTKWNRNTINLSIEDISVVGNPFAPSLGSEEEARPYAVLYFQRPKTLDQFVSIVEHMAKHSGHDSPFSSFSLSYSTIYDKITWSSEYPQIRVSGNGIPFLTDIGGSNNVKFVGTKEGALYHFDTNPNYSDTYIQLKQGKLDTENKLVEALNDALSYYWNLDQDIGDIKLVIQPDGGSDVTLLVDGGAFTPSELKDALQSEMDGVTALSDIALTISINEDQTCTFSANALFSIKFNDVNSTLNYERIGFENKTYSGSKSYSNVKSPLMVPHFDSDDALGFSITANMNSILDRIELKTSKQPVLTVNDGGITAEESRAFLELQLDRRNPYPNFTAISINCVPTQDHLTMASVSSNNGGAEVLTTLSVVHNASAGDSVVIAGTTNYDGTYTVLAVPSSTSFTITKAFVVIDTEVDPAEVMGTCTFTFASPSKELTVTGITLPHSNGQDETVVHVSLDGSVDLLDSAAGDSGGIDVRFGCTISHIKEPVLNLFPGTRYADALPPKTLGFEDSKVYSLDNNVITAVFPPRMPVEDDYCLLCVAFGSSNAWAGPLEVYNASTYESQTVFCRINRRSTASHTFIALNYVFDNLGSYAIDQIRVKLLNPDLTEVEFGGKPFSCVLNCTFRRPGYDCE